MHNLYGLLMARALPQGSTTARLQPVLLCPYSLRLCQDLALGCRLDGRQLGWIRAPRSKPPLFLLDSGQAHQIYLSSPVRILPLVNCPYYLQQLAVVTLEDGQPLHMLVA
jgi:hypothetical protein